MADQRISDILKEQTRPLLSYEFFPPKNNDGMDKLEETAKVLAQTQPDFVSCTWGAGGSTREKTLEVCERLRDIGFPVIMPHLTCVGAGRDELSSIADDIYARGFRNIMTLRGDAPKNDGTFKPHPEGFAYASELVTFLKNLHPDFCCGVAGYPERHPESTSDDEDILNLKKKLDAGADFVVTQLFYDNEAYFRFFEKCRKAGIAQRILPGLLPVFSLNQALRITEMCKAAFPKDLREGLEMAKDGAVERAGYDWAIEQLQGLLNNGAPGVHLYILNRSNAVQDPALLEALNSFRTPEHFSPR